MTVPLTRPWVDPHSLPAIFRRPCDLPLSGEAAGCPCGGIARRARLLTMVISYSVVRSARQSPNQTMAAVRYKPLKPRLGSSSALRNSSLSWLIREVVQYLSITLFVKSTEILRIGSMTADLRATLSDSTTKGSSGFRQHASGRMFRSWIKLKPLSIATFAVRHRSDCICLGYRSRSMASANEAADRGSSRNLQIALAAVAR